MNQIFLSILLLVSCLVPGTKTFAQDQQVVFVSAKSSLGSYNEGADKLIDGITTNRWFVENFRPYAERGAEVVFDAGKPVVANNYWFYTGTEQREVDRNPNGWKIEASNDNKTWEQIDHRVNQILPSTNSTKSIVYEIAKPKAWRYYRLVIFGSNTPQVELGEFCMRQSVR